jgi:hypothetical protein
MEYAAPLEIYAKSIERILTLDFATTWPGHHACPVNREVIAEFEEAAQDLLAGRAVGIEMRHPAGDAMRYEYKDIAIVYEHLREVKENEKSFSRNHPNNCTTDRAPVL